MSDRAPCFGADDPRAATLVTLDGPAGVGKSSTAKAVAEALGYTYLDSGALYRSVTVGLLRAGIPAERWPELTEAELSDLGVEVVPGAPTPELRLGGAALPDAELRTPQVTAHVPAVAKIAAVRGWLWSAQQAAAGAGRLVADGRDMGTVVFPQAGTKVFLVADPRERARRRLRDQGVDSPTADEVAQEAARLAARDAQDAGRDVAPLRKPDGAHELDTTDLDFDAQVAAVVDWARKAASLSD